MPNLVTVPKAESVADLRDAGGNVRAYVAVPVAPASGTIGHPAETPIVTVLKSFWQSPTIRAARAAVITAIGLAVGVVALQVAVARGDLSAINWETTQKAAIAAGAFSLATAYMTWWKTRDNNPVNGPKAP